MKSQKPFVQTDAILESISDGVFTVDQNWKITSFNRAAEQITGIPRSQAIGYTCSDVFKSSMCSSECALRKTLQSGKPIIGQAGYIMDGQGRRIPISVSTAVLKNEKGKVVGGAETFRDMSELDVLRKELHNRYRVGDLVSRSPVMQKIFAILPAISQSPSTVLIQGETGTGKEILARAVHDLSLRASKPFVAINCGALPDNLLESELFGYKAGAFTGAIKDKPGKIALAQEGTLFLDEIGEVSTAMQVRLLRVLQQREYEILGDTKTTQANIRVIAATNRDLAQEVKEGRFREDLYYRIHVVSLDLPPLRRRKEDIPDLVNMFLQRFNVILNRSIECISQDALALLMAHDWPGNVRELENAMERASILCEEDVLSVKHLPEELRGASRQDGSSVNWRQKQTTIEKNSILAALERNQYNRSITAQELGIHKSTLFRKITRMGIVLPPKDGRYK